MAEQLYEYKDNVFLRLPLGVTEEQIKTTLSNKMLESGEIKTYEVNPITKITINNTIIDIYRKHCKDLWYDRSIREVTFLNGKKESVYLSDFQNILADLAYEITPSSQDEYKFVEFYYQNRGFKRHYCVSLKHFLENCYKLDCTDILDVTCSFVKRDKYGNSYIISIFRILQELNIVFKGKFEEYEKDKILQYVDDNIPLSFEEIDECLKNKVVPHQIRLGFLEDYPPIKMIEDKSHYYHGLYCDNVKKKNPLLYCQTYLYSKAWTLTSTMDSCYVRGVDNHKRVNLVFPLMEFTKKVLDSKYDKLDYQLVEFVAEHLEWKLKKEYPDAKVNLRGMTRIHYADQFKLLTKIIIKYNEYIIKENGKETDKQSRSKRVV